MFDDKLPSQPDCLLTGVSETAQGIKTLAWLEEQNDIKYEAPPPPVQPALLDGIVGQQELAEYKMDAEFYVPVEVPRPASVSSKP